MSTSPSYLLRYQETTPSPIRRHKKCNTGLLLLLSAGVAVLCFGLGVLIGYFSWSSSGDCGLPVKLTDDATPGITQRIIDLMSADSISRFHRYNNNSATVV